MRFSDVNLETMRATLSEIRSLISREQNLSLNERFHPEIGGEFTIRSNGQMIITVFRLSDDYKTHLQFSDLSEKEDVREEILTLAHEFGHYKSHMKKSEKEKKRYFDLVKNKYAFGLITEETKQVTIAEEISAWKFAEEILRGLCTKPMPWIRKALTLATFQGVGSHVYFLEKHEEKQRLVNSIRSITNQPLQTFWLPLNEGEWK